MAEFVRVSDTAGYVLWINPDHVVEMRPRNDGEWASVEMTNGARHQLAHSVEDLRGMLRGARTW